MRKREKQTPPVMRTTSTSRAFFRFIYKNTQVFLVMLFAANVLSYYILQLFDRNMIVVHTSLDDAIPFVPEFVFFYILWYLYVPLMMLLMSLYDRANFYRQCAVVFGGTLICLLIFAVIPTTIEFRPTEVPDSFSGWICSVIYSNDRPMNVCPSQHCYQAIAVHFSFFSSEKLRKRFPRIMPFELASGTLVLLICASTMLIKQHSALDFAASVGVFIVVYLFIYAKKLLHRLSQNKTKNSI